MQKTFLCHPVSQQKNNMLARQKKAQIKCALDAENCCALKKKKKNYTRCAKKKYPNSLSNYSSFAISTI